MNSTVNVDVNVAGRCKCKYDAMMFAANVFFCYIYIFHHPLGNATYIKYGVDCRCFYYLTESYTCILRGASCFSVVPGIVKHSTTDIAICVLSL